MLIRTFFVIMLLQDRLCDAKRNAFQAAYQTGKQSIAAQAPDVDRVKMPGIEILRPYHWLMQNKYFKKRNTLF